MPDIINPAGPTLDYATPNKKELKPSSLIGPLLLVFVLLALLNSILIPSKNSSRPVANRVKCASNLRQIGQAILMYSNENHGAYPDSLGTLLMTEDITPSVFVCPSSNDTEATGPTTQAIATNMTAGGHLSYIYVGAGWNSATVPANAVVAYEPLANHAGDGMQVLFGDGHVDWVPANQAKVILANAGPGKPPVTMPTQ